MKTNKIIALLLLFIMPVAVMAAWNPTTNNAWQTAYAYQLQIVKYDGTGSPQTVGQPILIYHPDIMQVVYKETNTDLPDSVESMTTKDWGVSQMMPDEKQDEEFVQTMREYDKNGDALFNGLTNNPNSTTFIYEYDIKEEDVDDNTYWSLYANGETHQSIEGAHAYTLDTRECNESSFPKPGVSGDRPQPTTVNSVKNKKYSSSGTMGYQKYIMKYMTKARRVTYLAPSTSQYYKAIEDSNLNASTVANGYLDTLVKTYASSVKLVKQNFGVDINPSEVEKYYIRVEPVRRVLGKITKLGGSYLIKTIEGVMNYITKEGKTYPSSWTKSDWKYVEDTNDCAGGPYECSCGKTKSKSLYKYPSEDDCKDECSNTYSGGYCSGKFCKVKYDPYNCDCKRSKCNNDYSYLAVDTYCGKKEIHYLYGRYATANSSLAVVHNERAVDYCNEDKNRHCVLEDDNVTCKKDGNGNIIYEYYAGPSLEKGIVGNSSSNLYKLDGSCYSGTGTRGMKHYYFIDLDPCQDACANMTGDTLLKCAENYCDAAVDYNLRGSPRVRKESCILTCGYQPNNRSCEETSPYKNIAEKPGTFESYCSNLGGSRSSPAAITKKCQGDRVTNGDGNDANDTPFDQRKYINVACKEETKFEFNDVSQQYLVNGQGLDYYAKLIASKECQSYFNEEQWKFDYATISSKDPDRRKRLLYIAEVYNNALNPEYDKTKSAYYDKDFADQGDGEVDWKTEMYDTTKVSVQSRVNQVVNNKYTQGTLENLVTDEYIAEKDASPLSVNSTGSLKRIYNMNEAYVNVNKYKQSSSVEAYYTFSPQCVSADGKATVYKPDASGECYTLTVNGKKETVNAESKYFLDLNVVPDARNTVETYVSVGKDVKLENTYFEQSEACPPVMDGGVISCEISARPGTAKALGNNIFENGNVLVELQPYNLLPEGDYLTAYNLKIGNETYYNEKNRTISIPSSVGERTIKIEGDLASAKGEVAHCERTITIINTTGCSASCTINKINDKLYEIVPSGSVNRVYRAVSPNLVFEELIKGVGSTKYLVKLENPLEAEDGELKILMGKVENGTCSNVCRTEAPPMSDCLELYKPAETLKIREYCNSKYKKDVNAYENPDQCFNMCSRNIKCDDSIKEDLQKVTDFCTQNASLLGYSTKSTCINACYDPPILRKTTTIFRPINNYNPFPNSYDSDAPYSQGSRLVGKNWVGYTAYIKQDDEDKTSVTGANANKIPEYVIDLTPEDMRRIREDTDGLKRSNTYAYTELIYPKEYGKDYVGKYESKFIQRDYRNIFKTINE